MTSPSLAPCAGNKPRVSIIAPSGCTVPIRVPSFGKTRSSHPVVPIETHEICRRKLLARAQGIRLFIAVPRPVGVVPTRPQRNALTGVAAARPHASRG